MRLARIIPALVLCLCASPLFAADEDDWVTYVNREDRFVLNLPKQPTVEEFTYTSEYNSPWKARRYTVEHEGYKYVMTVVDMSTTSLTQDQDQFRNVGRHGNEKRGAMAFAAANLRKTGEVTLDAYDELQVIPGHKLEITLPDGGQNIVEIHPHGNFLYILECFSPPGAIPGYDVQSSLELLDADGMVPRYQDNNRSFPDLIPVQRVGPIGDSFVGGGAAAGGEGGGGATRATGPNLQW